MDRLLNIRIQKDFEEFQRLNMSIIFIIALFHHKGLKRRNRFEESYIFFRLDEVTLEGTQIITVDISFKNTRKPNKTLENEGFIKFTSIQS